MQILRGNPRGLANKIKCYHILVKKQSEAIMILQRLKNGESFSKLAGEISIDKGSAKRGGDLRIWISYNQKSRLTGLWLNLGLDKKYWI